MAVNFDDAIGERATTDSLGDGLWVLARLVAEEDPSRRALGQKNSDERLVSTFWEHRQRTS